MRYQVRDLAEETVDLLRELSARHRVTQAKIIEAAVDRLDYAMSDGWVPDGWYDPKLRRLVAS